MKKTLNMGLWMLLYLAFLKPWYFANDPRIDSLFNIVRIVVVFVAFFEFGIVKKRISWFLAVIVVYALVVVFSTFVNDGNLYKAATFFICATGGTVLPILSVRKNGLNVVFDSLLPLMELLIVANFVCIFVFPSGMGVFTTETGWSSNQVWLFGLRNEATAYILFGCIIAYLRFLNVEKTAKSICRFATILAISAATFAVLTLGGGLVGMICFLCFILLSSKVNLDLKCFIFTVLIFFFILTTFDISGVVESLMILLNKKTNTLTSRYDIWNSVWEHIIRHPVIGKGYQTDNDLIWLSRIAAGATTTHNTYLDILFTGGITAFAVFISAQFLISYRVHMKLVPRRIRNWEAVSFLSYFIVAQAEGHMRAYTMYMLLGLMWVVLDGFPLRKTKQKG